MTVRPSTSGLIHRTFAGSRLVQVHRGARRLLGTCCLVMLSGIGVLRTVKAQTPPPPVVLPQNEIHDVDFRKDPPIQFEAINPGQGGKIGDRLALPRRIAAEIVSKDKPNPHFIAEIGSYTGEFLEAFMQQFPNAHGQWTEPVDINENNAKIRLARFGNHVSYVIGCPARDISKGCIAKESGADVIVNSWVSIHQPLDGIRTLYKNIYDFLPSGGWYVNLDHVTPPDTPVTRAMMAARPDFHAKVEGPPRHLQTGAPTLEEQLAAFKAAGFDDVQVVWTSFNDVLFMARKR